MQIVISLLLMIIILLIVPYILGIGFERVFNKDRDAKRLCVPRCLIMGLVIMLALFQIIAVPLIVIGTSFNTLLMVWIITVVVYAAISVVMNRNSIKNSISGIVERIRSNIKENDSEVIILWMLAIALIIFETCLMIFRTHMDTDDSRFIAEAMEAYEKNSLLRINPITGASLDFPIGEMLKDVTSPYPLFIATISTLTRIHPAIMAHAILPVCLIPLSYIVSYLIADTLFADKKRIPVFMMVLAMIVLFSFESEYSWGNVMLGIIWQGRSLMAVIMLPFLWYLFLNIIKPDEYSKGMYIAILLTALACIDLSGMGGIMAPIIGGTFALAYLIRKRRLLPAILMGLCVVPAGVYMVLYKFFRP